MGMAQRAGTLHPTVRGMLWMAATGLLFTLLNVVTKKLSHELEPWLVGFLRYAMGALVMLPAVWRFGLRGLWPNAPRLQLVRGVFHTTGMALWFYALPLVTMAELTAIGFSGPLFICLGATLFLGERMTGGRWTAVLVGFSGVLLVVQPWQGGISGAPFGGISSGMLLMLLASPVFAGSFLAAKALSRDDKPEIIVLWQHLLVSLFGLPVAVALWSMPAPAQWSLIIVSGLLGTGGHYCMTRAFRVADISAVQSVKFLELVWAALLGFAVFGTIPGLWTVLGGVVIFVSTLLLARQESRRPDNR